MDRLTQGIRVGVLALTFAVGSFAEGQQSGTVSTPGTSGAQAGAASGATKPSPTSTRRRRKRRAAIRATPNQAEPATTPAEQAQAVQQAATQRQKDAQLLKQQQADSQRQQQDQERTVRQQEKAAQSQQNEPRIQDAPGPAQTGTVPGLLLRFSRTRMLRGFRMLPDRHRRYLRLRLPRHLHRSKA